MQPTIERLDQPLMTAPIGALTEDFGHRHRQEQKHQVGWFMDRAFRMTGRMLVLVAVLAATSCASPGEPSASRPQDAAPAQVAPSARAQMSLDDLTPVVEKPQRPASLKPLSERAARQVANANGLLAEQRFTEASIELERALRFDPNHPDIHQALARLHWQAGNVERAKAHAVRALEENPDLAAAHYVLGRVSLMGDDSDAAIQSLRTALRCSDVAADPEIQTLIYLALADALTAEGYLTAALGLYEQFERSLAAWTKDLPQDGTSPARRLAVQRIEAGDARSRILESLGRPAEAAAVLAELMKTAPRSTARGIRHARLLLQSGQTEAALAAARALESDEEEVITLLEEIHEQAGRPEQLVDDLRMRLQRKPNEPRFAVNLADALVRLGRPDEARETLEAFLQHEPGAVSVQMRLVELLFEQEDWAAALRLCAQTLRQHPDRAGAITSMVSGLSSDTRAVRGLLDQPVAEDADAAHWHLLGVLAAAAERDDFADRAWAQSLAAEPGFVPARVAIAEKSLNACAYDEALRVAGRLHADEPEDVRLERLLCTVHERLDQLEQAEMHCRAAVQMDPADAQAMLELARVYRRGGKANLAQGQLRVLLDQHPRHDAARELLARLYLGERKIDVAVEQLEELRRRTQRATTRARCDVLLDPRLRDDGAAARKVLQEAMDKGEPDPAAWVALAETYAPVDLHERIRAFEQAMALDPLFEEAAIGLERGYEQILEFEKAAETLESILQCRPNRHRWRLRLVELYRIVQDYDRAIALAAALEQREDNDDERRRDYRQALVETLRLAGRDDEAVERLLQWSAVETEDLEWTQRLAEEYLNQDKAELAVPLYRRIYLQKSQDWSLLAGLADALRKANRPEQAAQAILARLYDDPENDNGVWMLAVLLADSDKLEEALELIHNRLLHTPNREAYQNLLVDRLRQADRQAESLALIESMIDEAMTLLRAMHEGRRLDGESLVSRQLIRLPNAPFSLERLHGRVEDLRFRHAILQIGMRQFREAQLLIETWLEGASSPLVRSRYLQLLAATWRGLGDEAQAAAALERAFILEPDSVSLNNDVAYGWIDRGIRLDEADPMIRFAVWRSPFQRAYLDTYAWLLYKKGEFAKARKWLERARGAPGEDDPVIFDHLGDACWRLGDKEAAIEHWTAALALLENRDSDGLPNADEQRVGREAPLKLEAAKEGHEPPVAALAKEPEKPYEEND